MRLLSVSLDFEGREALLIGGGAVGRRKLTVLLEAGARVRVVEPNPAPWLLELAAEGLILLEKEFSERFLDESPWVFLAARLDKSLTSVAELAREKGLWLNVASSPTDSSFFLPALARDEPFRLAVSTGGASPALAARVARDLKATYHGYGAFCRLLARVRALVLAADLGEGARREILTALADDAELSALVAQAELGQAALLRERLESLMAPVSLPADFPL